jgi:hypothetical protein
MSGDEIRWRTRAVIRRERERIAAQLRSPHWQRRHLTRVLTAEALGGEVRAAVDAQDWQGAHDALIASLTTRPPRFVLDPASAASLRRMVLTRWPTSAQRAAEDADSILRGEHDVLGYRGLSFARGDARIDWHFDPVHHRQAPRLFYANVPFLDAAVGDHKIIWEINRHQYWMRLGRAAWLTGHARYAQAMIADLRSWLDANPPLIGVNWASMLEIGLRAIAWTWAIHCLLGSRGSALGNQSDPGPRIPDPGPWLVDMFIALDRQLRHVEHNLSYYFSPNTHLTGEALGLYVAGTAFPELAGSARWAATGRRILLAEIDRQILADGGHVERSTHYQRYTLDFYLLALLTARLARDAEAEARFSDASRRLADFTRVIADDQGRVPLLGDDDGGMLWPLTGRECRDLRDSLSVAAVAHDSPQLAPWGTTEEAVWVAGPRAVTRYIKMCDTPFTEPVLSRALADTGYYVARDNDGTHAVFDTGAHGYMNAGHAHADALSLALTLGNRPLLIDPGTSTYTVNPALRDRMRSSRSHNTVTVDGCSQSAPAGPFRWHSRANARLEEWRHNNGFDWAEGLHDGYAPLQHRRNVLRTISGGWLITDEILGDGRHSADAHWHFDPAWTVTSDGSRLRATHIDGGVAWLLHDSRGVALFRGDEQAGLGWYAPVYGTLIPTWTARVSAEGNAPFTMITWIGEGRLWTTPSLLRVAAQCDPTSPALAAQVSDAQRSAIFMLRPGGAAPHGARTCRVLDYQTDARVLHYLADDDRLLTLDVIDARQVVTSRSGWISIESDEPIRDLHGSFSDGAMDLRASRPPTRLRVRGGTAFHTVRLNRRELPPGVASRQDTFVIHAGDWRMDQPRALSSLPR